MEFHQIFNNNNNMYLLKSHTHIYIYIYMNTIQADRLNCVNNMQHLSVIIYDSGLKY